MISDRLSVDINKVGISGYEASVKINGKDNPVNKVDDQNEEPPESPENGSNVQLPQGVEKEEFQEAKGYVLVERNDGKEVLIASSKIKPLQSILYDRHFKMPYAAPFNNLQLWMDLVYPDARSSGVLGKMSLEKLNKEVERTWEPQLRNKPSDKSYLQALVDYIESNYQDLLTNKNKDLTAYVFDQWIGYRETKRRYKIEVLCEVFERSGFKKNTRLIADAKQIKPGMMATWQGKFGEVMHVNQGKGTVDVRSWGLESGILRDIDIKDCLFLSEWKGELPWEIKTDFPDLEFHPRFYRGTEIHDINGRGALIVLDVDQHRFWIGIIREGARDFIFTRTIGYDPVQAVLEYNDVVASLEWSVPKLVEPNHSNFIKAIRASFKGWGEMQRDRRSSQEPAVAKPTKRDSPTVKNKSRMIRDDEKGLNGDYGDVLSGMDPSGKFVPTASVPLVGSERLGVTLGDALNGFLNQMEIDLIEPSPDAEPNPTAEPAIPSFIPTIVTNDPAWLQNILKLGLNGVAIRVAAYDPSWWKGMMPVRFLGETVHRVTSAAAIREVAEFPTPVQDEYFRKSDEIKDTHGNAFRVLVREDDRHYLIGLRNVSTGDIVGDKWEDLGTDPKLAEKRFNFIVFYLPAYLKDLAMTIGSAPSDEIQDLFGHLVSISAIYDEVLIRELPALGKDRVSGQQKAFAQMQAQWELILHGLNYRRSLVLDPNLPRVKQSFDHLGYWETSKNDGQGKITSFLIAQGLLDFVKKSVVYRLGLLNVSNEIEPFSIDMIDKDPLVVEAQAVYDGYKSELDGFLSLLLRNPASKAKSEEIVPGSLIAYYVRGQDENATQAVNGTLRKNKGQWYLYAYYRDDEESKSMLLDHDAIVIAKDNASPESRILWGLKEYEEYHSVEDTLGQIDLVERYRNDSSVDEIRNLIFARAYLEELQGEARPLNGEARRYVASVIQKIVCHYIGPISLRISGVHDGVTGEDLRKKAVINEEATFAELVKDNVRSTLHRPVVLMPGDSLILKRKNGNYGVWKYSEMVDGVPMYSSGYNYWDIEESSPLIFAEGPRRKKSDPLIFSIAPNPFVTPEWVNYPQRWESMEQKLELIRMKLVSLSLNVPNGVAEKLDQLQRYLDARGGISYAVTHNEKIDNLVGEQLILTMAMDKFLELSLDALRLYPDADNKKLESLKRGAEEKVSRIATEIAVEAKALKVKPIFKPGVMYISFHPKEKKWRVSVYKAGTKVEMKPTPVIIAVMGTPSKMSPVMIDVGMVSGSDLALKASSHHQGIKGPERHGGIDLNSKKMKLDVIGQAIQMRFNSAMIAQFRKGNFTGVQGIILRIFKIKSPLSLLGMQAVL